MLRLPNVVDVGLAFELTETCQSADGPTPDILPRHLPRTKHCYVRRHRLAGDTAPDVADLGALGRGSSMVLPPTRSPR